MHIPIRVWTDLRPQRYCPFMASIACHTTTTLKARPPMFGFGFSLPPYAGNSASGAHIRTIIGMPMLALTWFMEHV